ncbi:ATP-binding cassette domain-containing protein [Streptomyces sp. NPDC008139]|uniref:sugar ABC transporter ATP-binding protein n=1 Tax=Streptomyces sp. NPDC008139 TaxID=3364814 RepID=UPI0036E1FC2C
MAPPEAAAAQSAPPGPPSPPPAAGAVLEAVRVSKRFPGVVALDDVSFTLREGEIHALVGENGAGKSTLIKLLTGVYRPDDGELRLAGEPIAFHHPHEAQRAGISTIYQEVNLVPLMSVARNIFLGREPKNRFGLIDFPRMHRETAELLGGFGITADPRRPLHTLGIGTQQMVALARAVSVRARVVVMDEPTSSLEPREVETLFRVIRELHERGISILYVSHRMDELYRICDRVTVLRDGRLVHSGDLADTDRVRLVSLMLGREIAEVRRHGATSFGEGHTAERQPVLTARGLTRRHLLHDIGLDLRPGEVLGLGGLLGSGRSETAKALSGALSLDSGEVTVGGHTVRRLTPSAAIRAGISLLPEDRKAEGIVPGLSVRENIVLAAMPRLSRAGIVSRQRQDRIVDIFMKRLRIKAAGPEQKVGELSGGNQQKVLLARWLCLEPKVLLLDEPTRGIDVGAKAEVQSLIDDLAGEGLAVLLISSDIEELVEGADRIVVLRAGAVAGELTGDDVEESALLAVLAETGDDSAAERDTDPEPADADPSAKDVAGTAPETDAERMRKAAPDDVPEPDTGSDAVADRTPAAPADPADAEPAPADAEPVPAPAPAADSGSATAKEDPR